MQQQQPTQHVTTACLVPPSVGVGRLRPCQLWLLLRAAAVGVAVVDVASTVVRVGHHIGLGAAGLAAADNLCLLLLNRSRGGRDGDGCWGRRQLVWRALCYQLCHAVVQHAGI